MKPSHLVIKMLAISVSLAQIVSSPAPSKAEIPAILEKFQDENWGVRADTLDRMLLIPGILDDARVQQALLARIEADHKGPVDGEGWIEDYYPKLLDFVEAVYRRNPSDRALRCLADGFYEPESKLAKWIAVQPGALPIFIKMLHDDNPGQRAKAAFMLAWNVQAMGADGVHSGFTAEDLRTRLRTAAITESEGHPQTAAITALGFCGAKSDIDLLDRIASDSGIEEYSRQFSREGSASIRKRLSVTSRGADR